MKTGLSGSKAHALCTRPHCIYSDCQLALRKSSCFVSSLIWDYADEPVPYQGLKERQKSKSILLKILTERKKKKQNKPLFFLTYIFLSYLMLLSYFLIN